MKNLMKFNVTVQSAFDNDNENFMSFSELLKDYANNELKEISKKEASKKIVEKFRAALGIEPGDKPQAVKHGSLSRVWAPMGDGRERRMVVYTLRAMSAARVGTLCYISFMAWVATRRHGWLRAVLSRLWITSSPKVRPSL